MNSHPKRDRDLNERGGPSSLGPIRAEAETSDHEASGVATSAKTPGASRHGVAPQARDTDKATVTATVSETAGAAAGAARTESTEAASSLPHAGGRRRTRRVQRLTTGPRRKAMTPLAQAANKANARNSTGPKSDAGKQASSRNAVTHGLTAITTSIVIQSKEDADAYEDLQRGVIEEYQPESLMEQWMVRQLGNAMWSVIRANRAQLAAIKEAMRSGGDAVPADDPFRKLLGEKPRDPMAEQRRTSAGVEKLITFVTTVMEDLEALAPEDATFWTQVREAATLLSRGVHGLDSLINANEHTLTKDVVLEILGEAKRGLQALGVKRKDREIAQLALAEDLALVPDTRAFHLIMRYTAQADRAVRRWMRLLAPLLRRARTAA
jgi:hypothetical protein